MARCLRRKSSYLLAKYTFYAAISKVTAKAQVLMLHRAQIFHNQLSERTDK